MSVIPDFMIEHRFGPHTDAGNGYIIPFDKRKIQPASYDLALDRHFRAIPVSNMTQHMTRHSGRVVAGSLLPIDTAKSEDYITESFSSSTYVLRNFVLASTIERVKVPTDMVGRVEGKSSLARLGLFVHVTAGFIDPGFEGHITLELFCANGRGITLYEGMPIAQISFEKMEAPAAAPYGSVGLKSKYQNAGRGPAESRYWQNFPQA